MKDITLILRKLKTIKEKFCMYCQILYEKVSKNLYIYLKKATTTKTRSRTMSRLGTLF